MAVKVETLCVDDAEEDKSGPALGRPSTKDRSQFVYVLRKCIEETRIDANSSVLVVGGTQEDAEALSRCGLHRITLSNISGVPDSPDESGGLPIVAVDAEDIRLPDNSYDLVFIYEVIHHCRIPHRALCELLRVAKHQVLMMEPNDSAFMRLLGRLRLSFPFELAAVVDNDYVRGGVRNSQIPNYIYRWNEHEVDKLACSFLAEYACHTLVYPYWDFNVGEEELAYRKQTRIGQITRVIGAKNFLRILPSFQRVVNRVPPLRRQGNKFFCCIQKTGELRPWLTYQGDGQIVFDQRFQSKQP
jgi:SAM-dependent methyltransferase